MKSNNNNDEITAELIVARLLSRGHITREEAVVLFEINKDNDEMDTEENTDYFDPFDIDNISMT